MRIILDTNVILAAFTAHGLSHAVFELCLEEHELFISEDILAEFSAVLRRTFKMPAELIETSISFLRTAGTLEKPVPVDPASCRDPSDLHILGLAARTRADVIISGDHDLLDLRSFQRIPILSPRQFWEKEHPPRPGVHSHRAVYRKKGKPDKATD
jgi:putative PIN family toxin of toxin-antitoxin system